MQSSRATMTPLSRGPVRQSRCAPLRARVPPTSRIGFTTEAPAQHSIQQAGTKSRQGENPRPVLGKSGRKR